MGALPEVCSKIVLIWLESADHTVCDSVNYSARVFTKWCKACEKILAMLISYILCASGYRQYCHVGNTASQYKLGLFQDADLADSKSTSGVLCIFGSHTFVPVQRSCKNKTAVSRSSTEAEFISLDAGLRLKSIPCTKLVGHCT